MRLTAGLLLALAAATALALWSVGGFQIQGVAAFLQGAIGGNQEEVGSRVGRPHITHLKLGHEITSWLSL
jgi:hypothetical protein